MFSKHFYDNLKGEKILIFQDAKSKTLASKKLFSASNQKHPAFQNTAHQILHGSQINLFHNTCLLLFNKDSEMSDISSLL